MAVIIGTSFFFRDNKIIAGNIRVRNGNNRFGIEYLKAPYQFPRVKASVKSNRGRIENKIPIARKW